MGMTGKLVLHEGHVWHVNTEPDDTGQVEIADLFNRQRIRQVPCWRLVYDDEAVIPQLLNDVRVMQCRGSHE